MTQAARVTRGCGVYILSCILLRVNGMYESVTSQPCPHQHAAVQLPILRTAHFVHHKSRWEVQKYSSARIISLSAFWRLLRIGILPCLHSTTKIKAKLPFTDTHAGAAPPDCSFPSTCLTCRCAPLATGAVRGRRGGTGMLGAEMHGMDAASSREQPPWRRSDARRNGNAEKAETN